MKRRDLRIALEHVHGATLEALAIKEGVSKQRVYQIWANVCRSVREEFGIIGVGPIEIGLYVQRMEAASHARRYYHNGVFVGMEPRTDAAYDFHRELKRERLDDISRMQYES